VRDAALERPLGPALHEQSEHEARGERITAARPRRRSFSGSLRWADRRTRGCDTAVWPRSEQPTAPRGPKPRSVKLSPLRTSRPTPSYFTQRTSDTSTPPCKHQIFHQPAHRVIRQRGDVSRAKAEATTQAAGHVVLSAALPNLKRSSRMNAPLAGIEAQHDLAQADGVEPAIGRGARRERRHRPIQPPSTTRT
jgi:hypothetical protein